MKKFAVMVTDMSYGSDCKAKLIALVDSQSQATNAAENHLQSLIREYTKNEDIEIVFYDRELHASGGRYIWQMSIQEIELDVGLIKF